MWVVGGSHGSLPQYNFTPMLVYNLKQRLECVSVHPKGEQILP